MLPVKTVSNLIAIALLIPPAILAASGMPQPKGDPLMPPATMKLSSTAFEPGSAVPRQFTCDGADVSPALAWSNAPAGAQSFALIADDPDAPMGTWVHWVLYDLPAAAHDLSEGVARNEQLPSGARQGRNDFGRIGYGGPCPPRGSAHRYFFKLYALDAKLNLKPGASKSDVERAMQGHILARAELLGRYSR
jgi:Raf kinase inhibitor-like YbhB/YbcL family protein